MQMIHDKYELSGDNIGKVGRVWLMASYLYYLRPDLESFLLDSEFDALTKILIDNFDKLETDGDESSRRLITMERLTAGTAFDIRKEDYPTSARHAAVMVIHDSFWTLKTKFIFKFPYVDRVGMKYIMDSKRVWKYHSPDKTIDAIARLEPALQDPERYYQGSEEDELYDKQRELKGVLLKDNEASEFYYGMIFQIDTQMDEGLVLGGITYDEAIGWIASVYDPKARSIVFT